MWHSEKVVLSLQESLFFSRIWGSGSERVLVWSDLCGRGGKKEGLTGFSVNSARAGLWQRSKRYRIRAISERDVRIHPKELARAVPGRSGERLQPIRCVVRGVENFLDDCRIFDTVDNLDGTATMLTGFNVYIA